MLDGTIRPYTVYGDGPRVAVVDLGVEQSLIAWLARRNCRITVVPARTGCAEILDLDPGAVILAGDGGTAVELDRLISETARMIGQVPLFGVSLGLEIVVRTLGGALTPLSNPHRGNGCMVADLQTGGRFLTSQLHDLAVLHHGISGIDLIALQISPSDQSIEAVCHRSLPVTAVHYHPDRGPAEAGAILDKMLVRIASGGQVRSVCQAPPRSRSRTRAAG